MEFQVVIPVLISFAISVVLGPVIIPFLRRQKEQRAYSPI